jgi:hypothetical protein
VARTEVSEGSGRETRLLALLVVVSIAVLFLLGRLRFPDAAITAPSPAPGPLSGLAARAAFDDMATTLANLVTRVSPRVVVVPLRRPAADRGRGGPPAGAGRSSASRVDMTRLAAALKVDTDLAVIPSSASDPFEPDPDAPAAAQVIARDTVRELDLIRVLPSPDFVDDLSPVGFKGFTYVGAVDVTPGGVTIHPVFVGRVDAILDSRWPEPLLFVGRDVATPTGTWIFAMDGRLIGMAVERDDGVAIVPRESILTFLSQARPSSDAPR